MKDLSIIIVNYNVEHFIEQCLLSVEQAIEGVDAEVIVVDNASVDGSVQMLEERFSHHTIIANEDNVGFSRANNQGIRIAQGRYVLLLNPDTVVEEDTFKVCIDFMDSHPDGGGLGVRMLDGSGKFLPESKRGLPTPAVAFYKIFGLSSIFPKSKVFGRYHLGYLDEFSSHAIDILSGAFMFLRKEALDKVGLLDEDYFMYGEDIDLSYRLTLGGYQNYYCPDTRIIHYKGESTKKTSVNYVIVFYNAMRIFAKKHFSSQNASLFNKLIELAIYARAGLSLVKRAIGSILHPLADLLSTIIFMLLLIRGYEQFTAIHIPTHVGLIGVCAYSTIWVLLAFLTSAYELPLFDRRKIQGILVGTGIILIGYALLPESWRFSRAIILLGTPLPIMAGIISNALMRKFSSKARQAESDRRYLIIGETEEVNRVMRIMLDIGIQENKISEMGTVLLNNRAKLKDRITIGEIDEVIFCARDLKSNLIIDVMSELGPAGVDFKIAPPESLFIVGSNSKNDSGDLLTVQVNSIARAVNKRNKRLLDVLLSLALLISSPLLIWFQKRPQGLILNIFKVMFGKFSWVGFNGQTESTSLPSIRKGVLKVSEIQSSNEDLTLHRADIIYAKDYSVSKDIDVILRDIRKLGSET